MHHAGSSDHPCACSTPCSGSLIWSGLWLLHRRPGHAASASKGLPIGRFTLAFVGYGSKSDNTVLELTHNWDTDSYTLGDGYGHIALGVEDIHSTCAGIADKGRPCGAGTLVR